MRFDFYAFLISKNRVRGNMVCWWTSQLYAFKLNEIGERLIEIGISFFNFVFENNSVKIGSGCKFLLIWVQRGLIYRIISADVVSKLGTCSDLEGFETI